VRCGFIMRIEWCRVEGVCVRRDRGRGGTVSQSGLCRHAQHGTAQQVGLVLITVCNYNKSNCYPRLWSDLGLFRVNNSRNSSSVLITVCNDNKK
jgi:hypothetical protein